MSLGLVKAEISLELIGLIDDNYPFSGLGFDVEHFINCIIMECIQRASHMEKGKSIYSRNTSSYEYSSKDKDTLYANLQQKYRRVNKVKNIV